MSSNKTIQVPKVIPNDWTRLRIIIDKLKYLRMGGGSTPTFTGLILTGLTDNSIIFVDNDGEFSENNTNLNWDDTNGILTVVDTVQTKDSSGNIIMFSDDTQFYITSSIAIPIEAGMPMGLLLALTYASP